MFSTRTLSSHHGNLKKIVGRQAVLTSPGELAVYAYDAALDQARPGTVVLAPDTGRISQVVRYSWKNGIPFVARGAGTNLCGASIPSPGGLVLAMSQMNKIISINLDEKNACVEPGVINFHLQNELAPLGFLYAPDPASQKACTLGGNVGTNAGGPHCVKYGVTGHHVKGLEIVLPDGNVTHISTEDEGPDLVGLFVGSEGTLGIVTKMDLNILPRPPEIKTMLVSFPTIEAAIQTVTEIIAAGIIPATLEAMDRITVDSIEAFCHAGYPDKGEAVLLIEVDGDKSQLEGEALKIQSICQKNGCLEWRSARDDQEREKLWEGRRGAYAATARLAPNCLVEDGAVPRDQLPEALRQIKNIAKEENLLVALLFHAGDGNLHPHILFDERDPALTKRVKSAGFKMLRVCVDLGGTISGEHGIGTDKREAMKWMFSPETLRLFRRIKQSFDPNNLCNPEKIIPTVSEQKDLPSVFQDPRLAHIQKSLMAAQRKGGAFIQGCSTKGLTPPRETVVIPTRDLSQIVRHDKANFTVKVEAGMTLDNFRHYLEGFRQYVHLDGKGSLGGIIATRHCQKPPIRDQILGMTVMLANGELVSFGAPVMKNVAGYDAAKILIGSWGTFGIIIDVTVKLYPFPLEHPELRTPLKPFEPHELHRKLKRAFDPQNVFFPSVFGELGRV